MKELQRKIEKHCRDMKITCPEDCWCWSAQNAVNALQAINDWINAYPLDIFPEPDLKKAARVLKENGMTLDSISASNMRHVLNRIKVIIHESEKKGESNA